MTRVSDVSEEAAVYIEDHSHCRQFCLWTHLHGWRQLALTKNKGFWAIWFVIFLIFFIISFLDILRQMRDYYSGATSIWTDYSLLNEMDQEGMFPAITICPATPRYFNFW